MKIRPMMMFKPTGVVVPYNPALMKTGNFEPWPKPEAAAVEPASNPEPEAAAAEPAPQAPKKGRPRKATAE